MKKMNLFLVIFSLFAIHSMINIAQASTHANKKEVAAPINTDEDVDPNEVMSDGMQRLEDVKSRRASLIEELKAKQNELKEAETEEKKVSAEVKNESVARLKGKIENHSKNIKEVDEKIKQAEIDHKAEINRLNKEKADDLERLKKEKDQQIKEVNDNHVTAIKDLNMQKTISAAKKAQREKELAHHKGEKIAGATEPTAHQAQQNKTNAKNVTPAAPQKQQPAASPLDGFGGLLANAEKVATQLNGASGTVGQLQNAIGNVGAAAGVA